MKKFELALGVLALLALIMKFSGVVGGGLLLVLVLMTLSLFYYLSFALVNNISLNKVLKKESYSNTTPLRIIGAVILGFALSPVIMGTLFVIQDYPGGVNQLIIGLFSLIIIAIVAFIKRDKSEYYKLVFTRIALIGGIGIMAYIYAMFI